MFRKKVTKKMIEYLSENCIFNPPIDLNSCKTIEVNSGVFILDGSLCYKRFEFTNVYNIEMEQLRF